MPILRPANWFQLYNQKQADFQLAVNATRMDSGEKDLWHNIEVMRKVIDENGLEGKLEEAYQHNLANYTQIEIDRYERNRLRQEKEEQRREANGSPAE